MASESFVMCALILLLIPLETTAFELPKEDLYEGSRCKTHNGDAGVCKVYDECIEALRLVKSHGPGRAFNILTRCGFESVNPVICCKSESKVRVQSRKAEQACEDYKRIKENFGAVLDFHIFNGEDAQIGDFPHMASVATNIELSNETEFTCGGSLISPSFVLTAAHCVNNILREPKFVRLGKTSKDDIDDEKAVDVKIKSFVIHANYSTKTKYNDIALLELERPLDESEFNRLLLPGCLHTDNELISNLNITGWGRNNSESLSTVNWLQVASVSEVTVEDCNRSYANLRRRELLNTQLCAKGSNSADACQGDSGGPIQYLKDEQIHIVGITSYGIGCGVLPGIYSRVSSYIDWIENIVWPN